jgi:hypothetical protein
VRNPLLVVACVVSLTFAAGCDSEPLPETGTSQSSEPAAPVGGPNFDPASCGTVTGLVTWVGPIPEVAPAADSAPKPGGGRETRAVTLANAPRIDRFSRGVAGVVVYLREVDTARAKPWDLPPVNVEFRDSQLVVVQGESGSRAGFVRRGDSVRIASAEERFHIARGRGAAFFSYAFPDPHKPVEQKLEQCGRVDLTCAAGCYWQAAQLFVCDHPYYAVTNAAGEFRFTQVPAGKYDLVAWHPNWVAERMERNPESGLPARLVYAPPLETSRPVVVTRGRLALANLTLPK